MVMPSFENIQRMVELALSEDVGEGDITAALLPPHQQVEASLYSREKMLVCGQAWVTETFHQVDSNIQVLWEVREGDFLEAPCLLARVKGNVRGILTAERTALNFLQTLSGTATTTHQWVQQLSSTTVRLLDTRKTIPGLRLAQKYAVCCGGAMNHRMGLYDAFLIKENHIKAYGSIANVIQEARKQHPDRFLEIEVETLSQLKAALAQCPDRILLDNFTLPEMREAVQCRGEQTIPLEVSGGVSPDQLLEIAHSGIDFISMGALTKHVKAIDLSLRL